jgi:hypothetical protein
VDAVVVDVGVVACGVAWLGMWLAFVDVLKKIPPMRGA